jgi:hypothetical protein
MLVQNAVETIVEKVARRLEYVLACDPELLLPLLFPLPHCHTEKDDQNISYVTRSGKKKRLIPRAASRRSRIPLRRCALEGRRRGQGQGQNHRREVHDRARHMGLEPD